MTSEVREISRAEGKGRLRRFGSPDVGRELGLLALALGLVGCLQALFLPAHVPFALKAEIAGIVFVTILRPFGGLLAVAALVPFSQTAALLWNAPHVRWADATVFAFLGSWLVSARVPSARGEPLNRNLSTPVLFFASIVLASCMVQLLELGGAGLTMAAASTWRVLTQDLFFLGRRTAGLPEGMALLEGLALFLAAFHLCGTDRRRSHALAAVTVSAAVGAAVLSILLARGIGLEPVLRRAQTLSMVRVAAHVSDVNAAGSYFAMTGCLALGTAARTAGPLRAAWVAAAGLTAIGLWLSGSHTALVAALAVVGLIVVQLRAARFGRFLTWRAVFVSIGLALLALVAARRAVSFGAVTLRLQFVETGLRMLASAPVFGVGVGRFYPLSRRFMSPELGWKYSLENAHNYFLQMGAELGVVGLAAFLYLLYAAWKRASSGANKSLHRLGALAGLGAFLATWLTGHPLLVPEVAYPFWMVLALAVVWGAEDRKEVKSERVVGPRGGRLAVAATALIVVASVPFRAAPLTRQTVIYGVYDWDQASDNRGARRARWTRQYATVIVRPEAGSIQIPMRAPRPTGVDIAVDGQETEHVELTDAWQLVRIVFPSAAPETFYRRVDLRLNRTWPLSELLPGGQDTRLVGIQLGEIVLSANR